MLLFTYLGIKNYGHYTGLIFFILFSLTCSAEKKDVQWWLTNEFIESTLSKEEQLQEMNWFVNVANPYQGLTIRVVSEPIATHWYESNVLTKAFTDITGINVVHETTAEDDVVTKMETQIELGFNIYDAYIGDSDLIGTHFRSGKVVNLTDFIENEGKEVTLPTLDLDDFIGLSFTTGLDGKLYQLPDQQFANLYWYRHDWFSRPDFKEKFKSIYGYELGVPVNWSAYEDIADFFTNKIKKIDGKTVYGHMDYGKKDPSLAWRFSDAWLSMAGAGDKGLPNGMPVDEWGIRVEDCHPVGASVARGGALNSPAAVYALRKYKEWLVKFAPPEAINMDERRSLPLIGEGNIAQQIFWYTAYTASLTEPSLPVTDSNGIPKWRMAPSPRGAYWEPGMKMGYQDVGAWTFLKNTPLNRRKAAWLYAQFVVSKTVSLRKLLVGLTPIRKSDINSVAFSKAANKYGGLVEFYRSNARNAWTPTGLNVPNYPLLSEVWWTYVSLAVTGTHSVQQAMNKMAQEMDNRLQQIAKSGQEHCEPKLNKPKDESYWLNRPGAPKPKLANEEPPGETLSYEESLKAWD
ncbi:carbohydrate ABC transporter substrate-binding protein [Zooshikella marina]|uniref:ABC transporter substrate-binding protein n=1 Tax=Zooshikella ganghwensis TaxID=202772 RepID=UPI001BB0B92F|nr:ABC transporter substrate-binding protein [Zooshikella ganghwensis]MBU2705369.1 carbohydrate ABC transporter substrate-binding protein [Zooshikella ganghwensis]